MKRWVIAASVILAVTCSVKADPPPIWQEYSNALVGIRLQVKHDWQVVEIQETKQTGTAAFNLSPHTQISIVRQSWGQAFDVWTSSEILTQIFKPGYKITRTEFAGRKSVLVSGLALDGRTQQSYYSDRPPFIDEITFTCAADEGPGFREAMNTVKQSIHWTR